eukprot:m.202919 g.202919  ORF g.202919 m.202919 type:complete len:218 (-) comp15755_c0_seq19:1766-2419(-)
MWKYLRFAIKYGNSIENIKFCLMTTLHKEQETEFGQRVKKAKSMFEICAACDIEEEFKTHVRSVAKISDQKTVLELEELYRSLTRYDPLEGAESDVEGEDEQPNKKQKTSDEVVMDVFFVSRDYKLPVSHVFNVKSYLCNPCWVLQSKYPKNLINNYCVRNKLSLPEYTTRKAPNGGFLSVLRYSMFLLLFFIIIFSLIMPCFAVWRKQNILSRNPM